MMGQFIERSNFVETLLLIGAALLLVKPGSWTDLIGFSVVLLVCGLQYARMKYNTARTSGRA